MIKYFFVPLLLASCASVSPTTTSAPAIQMTEKVSGASTSTNSDFLAGTSARDLTDEEAEVVIGCGK